MGFKTWESFQQAMHNCNCALIGWPTNGKDARDCSRPGSQDYDWATHWLDKEEEKKSNYDS